MNVSLWSTDLPLLNWYRYPSDPEKKRVFSGLNLTIRHGQTTGICGQTGCGKSTLLRLLVRLYDVQEGAILLNGRNIRDYEPQWLRANVAFVTSVKDTYLFSTTVRENIEFGTGSGFDPDMPEPERIRLVRQLSATLAVCCIAVKQSKHCSISAMTPVMRPVVSTCDS